MIDDLITLGVDEPYRMFTSRAERRLILRQDNVFARLMPYAKKLGLVEDELYNRFLAEEEIIATSVKIINAPKKIAGLLDLFRVFVFDEPARHAARTKLLEVLAEKEIDATALSSRALTRIYAEIIYAGYIEKEQREVEKVIKNKNIKIPEDFSYANLPGLSTELTKKLTFYKPATLADSELIPGMTPAGVSLILFHLNQAKKNKFSPESPSEQ